MRAIGRLDGFYDELRQIHGKYFQDWRFVQLMSNFIQWFGTEKRKDIFFLEEDAFLTYLNEFVETFCN